MIMKIYNIKQLFVAAVCVMALAACSSDDTPTVKESQRYPISLSNNLGVLSADATRASGAYDAGFLSASEFWAWADMTDEGEPDPLYRIKEYIKSWFLTVNSADNSKFDASTPKLFPVYNKLSFYAMHGNFGNVFSDNGSSFPELLYHNVMTNQTGDGNYLLSDLVYAVKPDVVPQAAPVQLAFQHLLSKIEVALKPGAQMTEAQLKEVNTTRVTVKVLGTRTGVFFRPSKSADLTTLNGRNSMLTLDEDSEPQGITLSTVTTSDFANSTCAAAIVVPQTVNGHFICLSYQDHNTYFDVTNLELKSGYRYRFNFTVDRIGDTFEVTPDLTVAPWDAEVIKAADFDTIEDISAR